MNIAIILSGGTGTRMGSNIPKQYIMVGGHPIIEYSINAFSKRKDIDMFVIVIANEWEEYLAKYTHGIKQPIYFARPGENRQHSIYNALRVAKENNVCDSDIVIIHDAARPMVHDEIIDSCISGCQTHDGVLPVIRVKDTIYLSEDGTEIKRLLKREQLFAGQAPESFVFGKYLKIHDDMTYEDILKINGSTEIAYKMGLHVKLVKGDEMNFKITTPEDLKMFEAIINK